MPFQVNTSALACQVQIPNKVTSHIDNHDDIHISFPSWKTGKKKKRKKRREKEKMKKENMKKKESCLS